MQLAGVQQPSGMAAVIGLDMDRTLQVCRDSGVQVANVNTADQLVIAGPTEATSLGNVILQLYGLGQIKDLAEGRQLIADSFPTKSFQPQDVDSWKENLEKYKSITQS